MNRFYIYFALLLLSCQTPLADVDLLFQAVNEADLSLVRDYKKITPGIVNQTNEAGYTPLLLAAEKGLPEHLLWLLENGADPNLTNSDGKNAIALAKENQHLNLLQELYRYQYLDWKARRNPFTDSTLKYAIENDNMLIVRDFLEVKNYLPDYAFPDTGVPILVEAVFNDATGVIDYLLSQTANPNIRFDTRPVLSIAAMFGQYDICKLLLEAGANPNETDGPLTTPLMFAAEEGHAQVVQLLLENGANPQAKDRSDETAYDKAVNNKRIDVVRLF